MSASQVVPTPYQSDFINYTWSPGKQGDFKEMTFLEFWRLLLKLKVGS